jgi:hypothetical protein
MTRDEKIAVLERSIHGLGHGDFSQVPFADDVSYESPLTPKRTGQDRITFLTALFPIMRGADIQQHIVEGEYVATVFHLRTPTGVTTVFDKFRDVDGKLFVTRFELEEAENQGMLNPRRRGIVTYLIDHPDKRGPFGHYRCELLSQTSADQIEGGLNKVSRGCGALSRSLRAVFFLEDPILQAALEGYREYSHRVPYKLIPHLW